MVQSWILHSQSFSNKQHIWKTCTTSMIWIPCSWSFQKPYEVESEGKLIFFNHLTTEMSLGKKNITFIIICFMRSKTNALSDIISSCVDAWSITWSIEKALTFNTVNSFNRVHCYRWEFSRESPLTYKAFKGYPVETPLKQLRISCTKQEDRKQIIFHIWDQLLKMDHWI